VASLIVLALGACAAPEPMANNLAFPPIKDMQSLKIRLTRSPCFGACPSYAVEITGDGAVSYCGIRFVKESGMRTRTISKRAVEQLVDKFRAVGFFRLPDRYAAHITDIPSYRLGIEYDGRVKGLLDYGGEHVGMPSAVTELEKAVDAAANTGEWIGPPTAGSQPLAGGLRPECAGAFEGYMSSN
jgi:hypothetical protein